MENIWGEIRNDFEDADEKVVYIDAWLTGDDDEDGKTIAKVSTETGEVEYIDKRAMSDKMAQEVINETQDSIDEKIKAISDAVIVQIQHDCLNGDVTVLEELLLMLPKTTLLQALPEDRWEEFE